MQVSVSRRNSPNVFFLFFNLTTVTVLKRNPSNFRCLYRLSSTCSFYFSRVCFKKGLTQILDYQSLLTCGDSFVFDENFRSINKLENTYALTKGMANRRCCSVYFTVLRIVLIKFHCLFNSERSSGGFMGGFVLDHSIRKTLKNCLLEYRCFLFRHNLPPSQPLPFQKLWVQSPSLF